MKRTETTERVQKEGQEGILGSVVQIRDGSGSKNSGSDKFELRKFEPSRIRTSEFAA